MIPATHALPHVSEFDPHVHRNLIRSWRTVDLPRIELQRGLSVNRPVPRHWHEEYQFVLIENGHGDLTYRGKDFPTPPASLFVVHPGEVHSNRSFSEFGCSFRTIFMGPEVIADVAHEMQNKSKGFPFFPSTVIFDLEVIRQYIELHKSLDNVSATLEREVKLQTFLAAIISRFAEIRTIAPLRRVEQNKVQRACDYLAAHYTENVSLRRLAEIAGLSSFHLNRVFSEKIGMPPHAYQVQLRLNLAKKLLCKGLDITQTACQTGFADQSHLTRHFKRIVGITPGRYIQDSKNVQDFPAKNPYR